MLTAGTAPTCTNPRTQNLFDNTLVALENGRVQCTWGAAINNGFQVYGYKVLIESDYYDRDGNNFGTFHNVVANCEEYLDQRDNNNWNRNYIEGNTCTLSHATLRAAPFNLPEQAPIRCQVIASNAMGDSDACVGSGAVMPVLARVPDAPTVQFVSRACRTLVVQCNPGLSDNGAEVTGYTVSYYRTDLN